MKNRVTCTVFQKDTELQGKNEAKAVTISDYGESIFRVAEDS